MEDWAGPGLADFLRDDSREQWWSGNAGNACYNPAYDYSERADAWLVLNGGVGSDSPASGCWVIERNPEGPQPWRVRNVALLDAAEAGWVPRYQWRNHARFRGRSSPWMYVFGGRERQATAYPFRGIPGVTLQTMWGSRSAHRVNIETLEVERLPDLPMVMIDGAVSYDDALDVFVLACRPFYEYPRYSLSGSGVTDELRAEFPSEPIDPSRNAVVVFDPRTGEYQDVTPPGFVAPSHPNGGWRADDGWIYLRHGSATTPALPNNQSQNWQFGPYWGLRVREV